MGIVGTQVMSRGAGVGDGGVVMCGWGRYEYCIYLLCYIVICIPYISRFVFAFSRSSLDVGTGCGVTVSLEFSLAVLTGVSRDHAIAMGPAVSVGVQAGLPCRTVKWGAADTIVNLGWWGRCSDGGAKFVDQRAVGG
jgi:hypothetical protein